MPFTSQAQRRLFHWKESQGELPKGTAARWEAHTPKGKKLPERAEKSEATEKAAFVRAFLVKCAADGATDAVGIAAAAEALARELTKRANVGDAAGTALGLAAYGPVLGAMAPVAAGAGLGSLAGIVRNQADKDDVKTLRLAAIANAYRRRAAESRTNAQVRRVIETDPSKYVLLG